MTDELARQLVLALKAAPYGGKEAVLAHWAAHLGLSRSSLLRAAGRAGYQPQERKPRADAGRSRAGISADGLDYVVALMTGSHRKVGRMEMPTTEAVEECIRRGVLPPDTRVETVRRLLRQRGASRRALQANYTTDGQTVSAAHVRLVSDGPNHMHQVDVSACLHWYFRKRGGLAFRHQKLDLAGGKKAEPYRAIREHILRYVLVDHATGALFVRYYLAAGETALNMIDCLHHAWRRREHPQDIFHGAPRLLYFDRGAANTAAITANLLDNLQVRWEAHQAGNSRATGAAEVYQRIWQQHFESKLFLRPPENLEELNARADDARIYFCATRINRATGQTRWQAWSGIRGDELRVPPPREVWNELVHERPHLTRASADGIVRHKGSRALILEPINVGEPIMVLRNPYKLPELCLFRVTEDGGRGAPMASKHVADERDLAVAVGEFRRRADTPAQKAMKLAGGLDLSGFSETVFAAKVDELPANVRFLERKGSEIAVEPPAAPEQASAGDDEARPAWFATGTDRYEWCLRRRAAGAELGPADRAWMEEFERDEEYIAQVDWFTQLRAFLAQQVVNTGGRA